MSNGISRRGFLKGAGIAAVGAMAAGTLTGCGKGTLSEQPKNEDTQAPGTPEWLGEPPEIDESEITETMDYDVVVVGCRTGGLPALISAAENGAHVLGIEQADSIKTPRADIGAINSRLQQEYIAEHPEYAIDKAEALEDIVRYANGFVSYDLVKLWEDESGAMVDWITDIIERDGIFKMNFEAGIGDPSHAGQGRDRAWPTSHSPEQLLKKDDKSYNFGTCLYDYAVEKGAEVRLGTRFVKCEQDDTGRVTGVIACDTHDKHYMRINAKNGVILSTGGYAGNTAMLEARQPWNMRSKINVPVGGGNSGDGIKAALWCGAHMDPIGAACMFNRACVKPDEYAGSDVIGKWFWFGEQPFLKLNLEGKRFCNESGPYDYMIHSAWFQPHHTYVDIWDSNYVEDVRQMDEIGCCRLYPWENGAPSNKDISAMGPDIENLINAGYVQKADTIEELASKLNIPVEQTVASFNRYNEFARNGKDEDYNKEPYRLIELNAPPYYGVRTGAWYLASLDGVVVNTNLHPIDDEGNPIEGLYITGNDSGGFFSVTYPNLFVGLACGRTMTFGRRAGRLAATGEA